MSVKELQKSIEAIDIDLKNIQERRESLIKGVRDVTLLCSKSIVSLHNAKYEDSSQQMHRAKELLLELRKSAQQDLYRYVIPAETELVEAKVLQAIICGSGIPSIQSLEVHHEAYILGLLDCIGELKRLVYDSIRKGKNDAGKNLFELMEQIYITLYPLAIYDNIVHGMRRKLDIARILIEDTRAAITEDSRRQSMLEAIDKLHDRLSRGSQ
jgi:translin